MGDVVPFRDPTAPLEGAERDAAIASIRELLPPIVSAAFSVAFDETCRAAAGSRIGLDDAVRLFIEAVRAEVDTRAWDWD